MKRMMLRTKIHRARVTDSNLNYEGSITIDKALLDQADLVEYEKVQVVNLNNGERFETYIIAGNPKSGAIELNGPAARLAQIGDLVIIMAYGWVNEEVAQDWKPKRIQVDENNQVKEILC
jgi:aspartate 1-decarboxylase